MTAPECRDLSGYWWFRHHRDASTFIAIHEDGLWFMPGVGVPITPAAIKRDATRLGRVPRRTQEGASVDH